MSFIEFQIPHLQMAFLTRCNFKFDLRFILLLTYAKAEIYWDRLYQDRITIMNYVDLDYDTTVSPQLLDGETAKYDDSTVGEVVSIAFMNSSAIMIFIPPI